MTPEQRVLNGLNEVKDNLWLGDIKKTREIIDNILSDRELVRKHLDSFQEVRRSFEMVKEKVKEQYKKGSFEYEYLYQRNLRNE
jgi:hypothetical protein